MIIWSNSEKLVLPLTLLGVIIISVIIGFLFKNKSEKVRNIPLTIIISIMLMLEVIKQIRSFINGTPSTWQIPLHFCSTFMIWYAFSQFCKGKVKTLGQATSLATSFMFLALFYFNPSSIIGDSASHVFADFGSFHTFIYHHLILLFLGCFIALRVYKPKYNHVKYTIISLTVYFIIAITFAHILNTNFTNLLTSNIPFMETFRLNAGQFVYSIAMLFIGLIASSVFLLLYCFIYDKMTKNYLRRIKLNHL